MNLDSTLNGLLVPATPTKIRTKSYSSYIVRSTPSIDDKSSSSNGETYSDPEDSPYHARTPGMSQYITPKMSDPMSAFPTPPSTVPSSSRKDSMTAARLALQLQESHLQKQLDTLAKSSNTTYYPPSPSAISSFSDQTPLSPSRQYQSSSSSWRQTSPPRSPLPPLPPLTPTEPSAGSTRHRATSTNNPRRLSATYQDSTSEEAGIRSSAPRRTENFSYMDDRLGDSSQRRERMNSFGAYNPTSLRPPQDAPTDQYGRPVSRRPSQQDVRLADDLGNASEYEDVTFAEQARETDLASWAPAQNPVSSISSSSANLPNWSQLEDGGLTSLPNRAIQRDIDYTLRKLLNVQVFEQVLMDPLGRHRFRDFLVTEGASTAELDMWFDVMYHEHLLEQIRSSAEAMQELYLTAGSANSVRLPSSIQREMETSLRKAHTKPTVSLDSVQQHLLEDLYHNQFQSFVKQKIIEQAHVKLGKNNILDSNGLGDCFCLTNPRLRDHPIVLVSDGFNAVTGYPRAQIVGRNCRFLQGPGTAPESVDRIRAGLNSGEEPRVHRAASKLPLGRDGTPFYCLLCIIPLRDAKGQLAYFIGGQTNVTGVFADNKNLSFLITGSSKDDPPITTPGPIQSPTMVEYQRSITLERPGTSIMSSRSQRRKSGVRTAGMVDSFETSEPFSLSAMNMRPPPSAGGPSVGKMIGRLFKKQSTDLDPAAGPGPGVTSQRMPGAEAMLSGSAKSLEAHLAVFNDVYSKLIVFKKAKREVIFVTRHLLAFLGLPSASTRELYSSPLIHSDLLDCVTAGDKTQTKLVRTNIKRAIKADESLSLDVGLQFANKSIFSSRSDHLLRNGVLHLTPLKERDGGVVAYVGVFG